MAVVQKGFDLILKEELKIFRDTHDNRTPSEEQYDEIIDKLRKVMPTLETHFSTKIEEEMVSSTVFGRRPI